MTYPLEPLLAVRRYREDSAQRAVRRAETAVLEAEAHLVEQEEAYISYCQWRVEEENRRYDAIMEQLLSLYELDTFKAGLASLAAKELQYEEAVVRARQALEKAKEAVAAAREAARKAQRECAKILAHKDIWMVEARQEAARQEDLEMEEFTVPVADDET